MKKLLLIISLLIALALLSSCATATTVTPTALVEASPTSTPTSIPPTATIEPSPTVDPNMPEGATGKDANGNYTKTENGLTVIWNKDLNTWERHIMVNDIGVPLFPYGDKGHSIGLTDQMRLHVNISDKLPGFDKVESLSFVGISSDNYPELLNLFILDLQNVLKERMGSEFIGFQQFGKGELSLSFTTRERTEPWVWKLDSSIVVDTIDAPVGSGFQTWTDVHGYTHQTRFFTDEQGDLQIWDVPEFAKGTSIDQVSPIELMTIYFCGPIGVMNSSDLTQLTNAMKVRIDQYATLATLPNRTIFNFGPPQ